MSGTSTKIRTFTLAISLAAVLGFAFAVLLFKQGHFGKPIGIAKLVDGGTYTGNIQDGLL